MNKLFEKLLDSNDDSSNNLVLNFAEKISSDLVLFAMKLAILKVKDVSNDVSPEKVEAAIKKLKTIAILIKNKYSATKNNQV